MLNGNTRCTRRYKATLPDAPPPAPPRARLSPAPGAAPAVLPRRSLDMPLRMGYGRVSKVPRGTATERPVLECWGGETHYGAKEDRMKELRATVSDEEFAELEHLAQVLGVPLEELLLRSVAAYLMQVK